MQSPFFSGAVVLALTLQTTVATAQGALPSVAAAQARLEKIARGDGLHPRAVSRRISARIHEPKVIHYLVEGPETVDRRSSLTVADSTIARVADPGRVRAGETIGYAVVEGLAVGRTTVHLGSQEIELQVTDDCVAAYSGRIVAPASGATAWGEICVSAEWWRPDWPDDQAPNLQIGTGRAIEPEWTSEPRSGPTGLASYRIDLTTLPEGPLSLALIKPGRPDPVDSVNISILPTGKLQLVEGECEAEYELPPLPDNRKEPTPKVDKSPKASGGRYWNAASGSPRFRFPIDVPPGGGWYQITLAAGGDAACAALPVVGIAVDDGQYTQTRSSIAASEFHRVPIGTPIRLDAGRRILRIEFLNDFYGGRGVDRNLRLDKIEVAALASNPAPSSVSARGEMVMMTGSPAPAPMMPSADGAMMMNADMLAAAPGAASATLCAQRIVVPRLFDGAEINGDFELRSTIQWSRSGDFRVPPARTRLIINGQELASQVSAAPRFMISSDQLRPGVNTLQLASDHTTLKSPPILSPVYHVNGCGGASSPRGWLRRTIWDSGWDTSSRSLLTDEQSPSERACFGIYSNTSLELDLPEDLQGRYHIAVEAKGQGHKGNPRLEVAVAYGPGKALAAWTDQAELKVDPVGVVDIPQNWDAHPVVAVGSKERRPPPAVIDLRPGAKRLRLVFVNDLYEPDNKGDRNLWLQAVTLAEASSSPAASDASGLSAKFLWPVTTSQARAHGATAAILSIASAIAPESVEILIDGAATGQRIDLRGRPGPYVVPVSLRSVEAGTHTLALKVAAGGRSSTAELPLEVLPKSTEAPTTYERAIVLLDRLAYGPDERELASILALGEDAWLRDRVSQDASGTNTAAGATLARARYPDDRNTADVQRRAILEGLATANPVRARFVLWTQNHFSTWIRKTEARRKAGEHDRFSAMGVAPFAALLRTSATSPAMLRYLDQEQSFARKLNENYAREIMELHTLGVHGGYTQEDVTTLARILTGWTGARVAADTDATSAGDENGMTEVFRFDPNLGDDQPRVFLGRRFEAAKPDERYQRILTALDMLAGHPSTAKFISEKLAAHYTTFPPPPELVAHLTSVFESTGGDMQQMLFELAHHPAFWSVNPGTRLCHPVDFAFRLSRTCRSDDAQAVNEFLNLSGQGMFDRSTPDGYQENDEESMDSNAMLQRWKFSRRLENRLYELVPTDLRSGDRPIEDASAQNVIDLVAMRLTGRLLSDKSNAAALNFFKATEGRRDERWRAVTTFIASCSEVQVR